MPNKKLWIERTLVQGRHVRIEGPHAFGKASWSPQRASNNADIHSSIREIEPGFERFRSV